MNASNNEDISSGVKDIVWNPPPLCMVKQVSGHHIRVEGCPLMVPSNPLTKSIEQEVSMANEVGVIDGVIFLEWYNGAM